MNMEKNKDISKNRAKKKRTYNNISKKDHQRQQHLNKKKEQAEQEKGKTQTKTKT